MDASDRFALRLLPHLPDPLLRVGVKPLAAHSRKLAESASALCLVVAASSLHRVDLAVGQAVQAAWLALTGEGLAAQPMMSLTVLENVLESGSGEMLASLGRGRLLRLHARLRSAVPEIGSGRLAFLLRVGFAPPPTGRVGRRPVHTATVESPLP